MTIKEVYPRDTRSVDRILDMRARKEYPVGFCNMPRNVFMCGYDGEEEFELVSYNDKDYIPEFLSYMAHHYPHYEFWVTARTSEKVEEVYFRQVLVFQEDEPLGRIDVFDRYGGEFAFKNNRIDRELERKSYRKTSKINAAKGIFRKYFYGLSFTERMQAMAEDVKSAVYNESWNLRQKTKNAQEQVLEHIKEQLVTNNHAFLQYLTGVGKRELSDNYNKAMDNQAVVQFIEHNMDNRKGRYYLLQGDKYATWVQGDTTPQVYKREDMSDDVRMALGLLKVSDGSGFVEGAGFKLSDTQFFINEEVQFDFDS